MRLRLTRTIAGSRYPSLFGGCIDIIIPLFQYSFSGWCRCVVILRRFGFWILLEVLPEQKLDSRVQDGFVNGKEMEESRGVILESIQEVDQFSLARTADKIPSICGIQLNQRIELCLIGVVILLYAKKMRQRFVKSSVLHASMIFETYHQDAAPQGIISFQCF